MKQLASYILTSLILLLTILGCSANNLSESPVPGANQFKSYINLLSNKNVAIMANHTSLVDSVHLLDFLISKNIKVKKVFAIEHGFRGEAANGEEINSSIDEKTGTPIVSLYGEKKKPSGDDLNNIDIVVFDMQDVGCRFYTYISSMHLLMEACAVNNIELLVLDRPNPNGDYVAGPVLDPALKSFVGMHPIPVVHGCTIGELALMINGEGWLENDRRCELTVITVENYTHKTRYEPPIKPSPNLPNYQAIRLYPSLCFFEATNVSIGRGTEFPFQIIGYPGFETGNFTFTPHTIPGVSNQPVHEGEECTGLDLRNEKPAPHFTLKYFLQFHKQMNDGDFWKSKRWFELLSGNQTLYRQINEGCDEGSIIQSWGAEINKYKSMRKRYLLYPDFE
ncbi:MAG: DUF1343 domain-containing protein [Prolixibacteraceae bacterium]|jgi:uncharacterized protein YbbC (DUF1343 family)|nr:DUF1343 domain-containing protein [Prolixibacteraceae bacterium]